MERGAKTRGKYARMLAGAEAIEIKATIPGKQVEAALTRYKLTTNNDDERYIYFFDTPALELLEQGIIIRARRVVGDEHNTTIKFRPVDPAALDKDWRKFRDFKVEADASEKGIVKSASFTMPVTKGLIKRVVAKNKGIPSLFTKEQERFLAEVAGHVPDLDALAVLGPLRAQRWDFEDPACPWPLTAELWWREDGATLMEISVKAPAAQGAAVMAGFMAFLAEVGAERDTAEQAKTRWALEYHANRLRKQPVKKKQPVAKKRKKKAATPRSRKR